MTGLMEGSECWAQDGDCDFSWRSCILWFGVEWECCVEFHSSNVCISVMKSWNVV